MSFYHYKALQQFTKSRQIIINDVCRMTRQHVSEAISEAFFLNDIESDVEFKKKLNNYLSKLSIGNLKCGSSNSKFVERIDDQEVGYLDTLLGQSQSPLEILIAGENVDEMSGQLVTLDSKALANDLHISRRHARRIKANQLLISSFQIDLFENMVAA